MGLFDGKELTPEDVKENLKRRAAWEREDRHKHPPFTRHRLAKPDFGKPRKDTKGR